MYRETKMLSRLRTVFFKVKVLLLSPELNARLSIHSVSPYTHLNLLDMGKIICQHDEKG